jgi:hypothetical protein
MDLVRFWFYKYEIEKTESNRTQIKKKAKSEKIELNRKKPSQTKQNWNLLVWIGFYSKIIKSNQNYQFKLISITFFKKLI